MKNFKKLIKEAHLGNPLNEDKLPDGFHSKEDLDQFLKDNPFDSERYKKLSIAQKQDILSYLNRDTEKEFERRMAMREEFKKGDKVTYLGNPAEITFVGKDQMDRTYYSVSYDKGNGKTKASNLYNKGGEIKAVEEGTCGYGEDGKVDPENTDKLKPAGPINEIESGDIVTYKGEDHTVMRIEDDDLGVRVYIRPNEEAVFGGKKDTFWVKPEDLNEMLMQALPVEKLTDEALLNLLNNLDDDTGKFTRAKSELMKAAGDEVKRRGLKVHYVDNDRYEFMNEDMNDPVLVKTRAAQMKRDAMDKKDLENKSKRISVDKAIDLRYELSILDKEREDILMRIEDIGVEMDQTAEPEGGPIADKLGERLMAAQRELRAIDSKIIDIKDDLGIFDMNEGYLERAIEDEKDPKKLAMLKAKKEFYDNNPKEKRRGMSDKEIGDEVRRLLKRNFMEEEIETSLTPNEIEDLSVEKESDSAAYESLQESLRKKLQDRLK